MNGHERVQENYMEILRFIIILIKKKNKNIVFSNKYQKCIEMSVQRGRDEVIQQVNAGE